MKVHHGHIKYTLSEGHYIKLPEWQTFADVSETHQAVAEQENTDTSTDRCPGHLLDASYLNDNSNETVGTVH